MENKLILLKEHVNYQAVQFRAYFELKVNKCYLWYGTEDMQCKIMLMGVYLK